MKEIHTPLDVKVQTASRTGEAAGADASSVRVLVVDDDPEMRRSLARLLEARGLRVSTAAGGVEALAFVAQGQVDVMLLDLMMPGLGGLEVLRRSRALSEQVEVIMMTAYADVDAAVAAVKAGAYDFLAKPFSSSDAVALSVAKAAERGRLVDRTRRLEQELEVRERYGDIIGSSQPMLEVYRMVDSVAHSTSTVLIQGASGTGKELVARAVHSRGPRSAKPFVAVNCSAIPENLVESELFGHVRGAFTGAVSTRKGMFETADGGTMLLDEVGELPPAAQVKLLRALQEGEIKRVGSSEEISVDVRVIAATNVNLHKAVLEGAFREDLYYRLNVINILLPSLKDRPEDIPLLAYHFLRKYALRSGRDIRRISVETMHALRDYGWPGNVRELENAIERAVVMAKGDAVGLTDLPASVTNAQGPGAMRPSTPDVSFATAKKRAVEDFERSYVRELLRRTGGNVSKAARQAGLDRANFRRILRKYDVR